MRGQVGRLPALLLMVVAQVSVISQLQIAEEEPLLIQLEEQMELLL